MRFASIELTNYRSFGSSTERVELPEDENLVVLVGANNAGKSNLLDGFRLALGDLRRSTAEPDDFHRRDVASEMSVVLRLRAPLLVENVVLKEDAVAALRFRAWPMTKGAARGELRTSHSCLREDDQEYVPMATIPRRGKAPAEGVARTETRPARASDVVRRTLGPIYYLSPDLSDAFRVTGYGPLARLLDLYRDDFRAEHNTYTVKEGDVRPAALAFEQLTEKLTDVLRTKQLATIEEKLTENLATYLGPETEKAEVRISLPTPEELLVSALRLQVQDEPAGPSLPVGRLGAGYQSLLRIAVLRAYAELTKDERKAVFLVEEPEAYLHPHHRRFFRSTLRQLADDGHDVVVTTHDPAFVSLPEYQTVFRLTKDEGKSRWFRCTEKLGLTFDALSRKIAERGNEELFFAQRVVCCEGIGDVALVRLLLDHLRIDPDNRSISVLDCGGRENLPDYAKLLRGLGIPLLVVADKDASHWREGDTKTKVQRVIDAAGDDLFMFEEHVEAALGVEKTARQNTRRVLSAVEGLDAAAVEAAPELAALRDRLSEFAA